MANGSFQNPDNSFYDADEKMYYPSVGYPMIMPPFLAEVLKKKEARELSQDKVKELKKAAEKRMELSGKTVEKLKGKMGIEKFKSFVEWLTGEDFDLRILSGQLSEDLEINEHLRDNLRTKVEEIMEKKEDDYEEAVNVLARFFNFEKVNLKRIIPLIIEGWMTEHIQKKLRDDYKYINDFEQFKKGQCNIRLSLTISRAGQLDTGMNLTNYEQEYKEHEAKKIEEEKKAKEAAEVKRKAEKKAMTVQQKIDAIKNDPVGKILAFFISDESLRKIAGGKSPVLAFFLGMLGVAGFESGYNFVKKLAKGHPKTASFAKTLNQMEKKARETIESMKPTLEAAKTELCKVVSAGGFQEILSGKNEMPKEGVKLRESYELRGEKRPDYLEIDVSRGVKVILPTGKVDLKVNGNDVTRIEEQKPLKPENGVIRLEGTIPAGTVFMGENIILEGKVVEPA